MKVPKWILVNPTKSLGLGIVIGSPVIDFYLKKKSVIEKKLPVYEKLVEGSQPELIRQPSHIILRPNVMTDIKSTFFLESDDDTKTHFGVVIGPSGSGKTYAVTHLCNKYPKVVIYYEIVEPSAFVLSLSKEMCRKTAPATVLDLLLRYICECYTHYYVLPELQLVGLDVVLNSLEEAAIHYQEEFGQVAVLFLDGVDLLAKHDKELCCCLIMYAKVMANKGDTPNCAGLQ